MQGSPMRIDLECLYTLRVQARLGDFMAVLRFCMDLGLISREYECPRCGNSMKLVERPSAIDKYEWLCRTKRNPSHKVSRSVRAGSWFARSKLNIVDILLITEYFLYERTQADIVRELRMSSNTITDWRIFFREVCFDFVLNETGMIGGENVEVEIKSWKRKFNRGKVVQEGWVFGGVERGTNKCFLRVVEWIDKDTLLNIIKSCILPGTTIYSDSWKAYNCLESEGFRQLAENNSYTFENMDTNTTEEAWAAFKRKFPNRIPHGQFDACLAEYIWKERHSSDEDLMSSFLEGIKKLYPPPSRASGVTESSRDIEVCEQRSVL